VMVRGLRKGRTPMTFTMRAGARKTVLIAKGGYKDRRVSFSAGGPDENITKHFSLRRGTSRRRLGIPPSDPF